MTSVLKFILIALLACSGTAAADELELNFDPFGAIRVYPSANPSSRVIVLISGERGWDSKVLEMAQELASQGWTTIGVDLDRYLAPLVNSSGCTCPASDFENLSRFVQQKLNLPRYSPPVLLGCGTGGTLAYITLVQAPPNTFLGGLSLGFDPTAIILKAVCKGLGFDWKNNQKAGELRITAAKEMKTPWMLLPMQVDEKITSNLLNEFTEGVPGAKLVESTTNTGEFPARMGATIARIKDALESLVAMVQQEHHISGGELEGLPIVELPAEGSQENIMAVILSGDGGWAGIDREIGLFLGGRGIPVVGLNSLQYFWTPRTPEGSARDLALIISHYLNVWNKTKVILIGYSFGADVLPFLVNRMPSDLVGRINTVAMLGPSSEATFEFHLTDWVGGSSQGGLPVLPELKKISGKKILCIYGEEESDSLCRSLDLKSVQSLSFPGSHHFGGEYDRIAEAILKAAADNE